MATIKESAGGIIVNPRGEIVLVEQWGNSWAFPKGGVEGKETLLSAAKREIFEETGLQVGEPVAELGFYFRNSIGPGGIGETEVYGNRRRSFFLFKVSGDEPLAPQEQEGEITQARWATLDQALQMLTHPKDAEFLESVRSQVEAAIQ